jgi:hypothetical protein
MIFLLIEVMGDTKICFTDTFNMIWFSVDQNIGFWILIDRAVYDCGFCDIHFLIRILQYEQ